MCLLKIIKTQKRAHKQGFTYFSFLSRLVEAERSDPRFMKGEEEEEEEESSEEEEEELTPEEQGKHTYPLLPWFV